MVDEESSSSSSEDEELKTNLLVAARTYHKSKSKKKSIAHVIKSLLTENHVEFMPLPCQTHEALTALSVVEDGDMLETQEEAPADLVSLDEPPAPSSNRIGIPFPSLIIQFSILTSLCSRWVLHVQGVPPP